MQYSRIPLRICVLMLSIMRVHIFGSKGSALICTVQYIVVTFYIIQFVKGIYVVVNG